MTQADFSLPFQLETNPVRGRLVRLGPALGEILNAHAYPAAVSGQLAEMAVLSVLLSSALKYDGYFILQAQSSGPLRMMVADVGTDGAVRACARFDEDALAAAKTARAPVPDLLGKGTLAFTVDQGTDMQRYQGIAELDGDTLAECARNYFRRSEQLETAILVAADLEGSPRAAGLMIQRMPAEAGTDPDLADEDWRRAIALFGSLGAAELLDSGVTPETLLWRLFHEEGVRTFDPRTYRHACHCSRTKVETTLKSLPEEEVMHLLRDGLITVTCEFCSRTYTFDEAALRVLFEPG
jgi:molecular chaperone Hsp33